MDWDVVDFTVFGAMLLGVGVIYTLARRSTANTAYRVAVGVALAAAFILIWVNGAVGIIGDPNNDANMMYFGVLAIGTIGAFIARFPAARHDPRVVRDGVRTSGGRRHRADRRVGFLGADLAQGYPGADRALCRLVAVICLAISACRPDATFRWRRAKGLTWAPAWGPSSSWQCTGASRRPCRHLARQSGCYSQRRTCAYTSG